MTIKCATDSGAARSIPAAMASPFDPNNAIRYNNRADAYFELGQYQRAIQDLDKTIQLDSGDAAAYLMRSLAHNASHRHVPGPPYALLSLTRRLYGYRVFN